MTATPAEGPLWSAVNPRDAGAVLAATQAALADGTEIMALPLVDAARAFHPADPRLWRVTGLLYRALDDLAPAVAALEKAAALAPNDPSIAHDHARCALEAGLPAIYLYERALGIAPMDGEALLGLASARNAELGPASALELLDDQLKHHPLWYEGHNLFARLQCVVGQRARFTDSLQRAILSRPREVGLWRELILNLLHAELYEEALSVIGSARRAAGAHLLFDANEAVCNAEMGQVEAADRLFAGLGDVDDISLLVRRFRHLLRSGRPDQAAALAEPLLAGPDANFAAPYLSIAWRLLDDPRWQWLEGDERLVGIYDLADSLPPLEPFAARLRALHKGTHQPLDQSLRGGTQTHSELLSRIEPEIRALRRAIVGAVEEHISRLPPIDPGHPILGKARESLVRFSGSWSVRLFGGGHHASHIHPQGWFSSALYIALPEAAAADSEQAGWLALGRHEGEIGVHLPATRMFEPKPGRLVLFPSTMWHRTEPFAVGERLTVAFDVAPPH